MRSFAYEAGQNALAGEVPFRTKVLQRASLEDPTQAPTLTPTPTLTLVLALAPAPPLSPRLANPSPKPSQDGRYEVATFTGGRFPNPTPNPNPDLALLLTLTLILS